MTRRRIAVAEKYFIAEALCEGGNDVPRLFGEINTGWIDYVQGAGRRAASGGFRIKVLRSQVSEIKTCVIEDDLACHPASDTGQCSDPSRQALQPLTDSAQCGKHAFDPIAFLQ